MGPGVAGMPQAGEPSLLLSETRQQNTELRLTIGKMQDKIDQLLEKVCRTVTIAILQTTVHSKVC